jgi:hypothetical protein
MIRNLRLIGRRRVRYIVRVRVDEEETHTHKPMCSPMPILQAIMLSLAMRSNPFRACLLLSLHTNTVFCTALIL